jgi:hypothetical protein
MTDRATPETDAAIYCASPNESVVHLGFARKLENERDEAREERDALKADKDLIAGQLFAARGMYEDRDIIAAERDAALAKLAKCREALRQIADSTVMLSHDAGVCISAEHRDKARETLEATI